MQWLYKRYQAAPRPGDTEKVYVARDDMTPADLTFNLWRLRKEGLDYLDRAHAYLQHAAWLEGDYYDRIKQHETRIAEAKALIAEVEAQR